MVTYYQVTKCHFFFNIIYNNMFLCGQKFLLSNFLATSVHLALNTLYNTRLTRSQGRFRYVGLSPRGPIGKA